MNYIIPSTLYFIDGKPASYEDWFKIWGGVSHVQVPTCTIHQHRYSRYVGLQKVLEYCECGYEREVPYNEIGEHTPKA